jgi:hypothetical protein
MKTSWRTVLAAAFLIVLASGTTSLVMSADKERKPKVTVPVESIGSDVTLVGRMGEPLGTMMEVKGTWSQPKEIVKDNSPRFNVTHVNGKKLDTPVEFNIAQITADTPDRKTAIPELNEWKTLEGVSWTMRAYETGDLHIQPREYHEEFGKPVILGSKPYWMRTFTSRLIGVVKK